MTDEHQPVAFGPGVDATGTPSRPLALGPEAFATGLAVLIIGVITFGLLVATPGGPPNAPNPSQPAGAEASLPPSPSLSPVSLSDIKSALDIDGRLAADRAALEAELAAPSFDASATAVILRGANADLVLGIPVAQRLQQNPVTSDVGGTLAATYSDLHRAISDALDNSVQNAASYKDAAQNLVASLARLEPLDVVLRRIRDGAVTPPARSPSVPPSAGGSPGAPPSAPPSPPSSGGPGPGSPPPSAGEANLLVNPGFEAGVGAPWELVLASGASARLQADPDVHLGGATSARVDIQVAGSERASVAVRQGGLSIQAGSRYLATIAARAVGPREIRFRIASAAGDTYGTRLYTVGPDWQTLTIDFTVFATDPNAYLEIDLGRSEAATWLDNASFVQVAATSG